MAYLKAIDPATTPTRHQELTECLLTILATGHPGIFINCTSPRHHGAVGLESQAVPAAGGHRHHPAQARRDIPQGIISSPGRHGAVRFQAQAARPTTINGIGLDGRGQTKNR